jgi:hypothetical protein
MSACEWFVGVGDEAKSGAETQEKTIGCLSNECIIVSYIPHGFCGD